MKPDKPRLRRLKQDGGVPAFDEMLIPTIDALKLLDGSGTIAEIYEKVIEVMKLPPDILAVQHTNTGQTEVEYRLAWSRTYLRKVGLISRSERGVWALASPGIDAALLDPVEIVRQVREQSRQTGPARTETTETDDANSVDEPTDEPDTVRWEAEMRDALLNLSPAAFERLVQRMLRESGFIQVEVTGKSGDGGIDGIGIARINGFLSFQVLFQCKRFQGSVTPSQIRDFRGSMQGRTDKGLFITTGTFTREAVKEATRDGAPPIDLIDGEELVQRLKDLRLGVTIKMVEAVTVDRAWFAGV